TLFPYPTLFRSLLERQRPQPLLDLGLEVARPLDVDRDARELQLGPGAPPRAAPRPGRALGGRPLLPRLGAGDLLAAARGDDRAHLPADPGVRQQLDEIRA